MTPAHRAISAGLCCLFSCWLAGARLGAQQKQPGLNYRWITGNPLITALDRGGETYYSIKDPSIVRYGDRWHIFATVRGKLRSHQIEYLSFGEWKNAGRAKRSTLHLTTGYFCAPQVFYFRPQHKWYLIYQVVDTSRTPQLQPAYSTTTTLDRPESWTIPSLLMEDSAKGVTNWIDFWVICDRERCHLFFTTLNGKLWRASTRIADFPRGWTAPQVALQSNIYEASHTYRLKDGSGYLTIVEAQGPAGRRYFASYRADTLEGPWHGVADDYERAFASPANVRFTGEPWTDSFSHGELLRAGYDETLTVDPSHLQFLFQGVLDQDRQGKPYGQIPWRLGLLEAIE